MPRKRRTGRDPAAFSCFGKVRIPTEAEAKRASRRREGRHPYFCVHCHGWHVGGDDSVKPLRRDRPRPRLRPEDVLA